MFFEKVNTIDKTFARLIRKKKERAQINKIRNERGEVKNDTTEMQWIIRDDYNYMPQNGKPRRNRWIPKNVQSPKTE